MNIEAAIRRVGHLGRTLETIERLTKEEGRQPVDIGILSGTEAILLNELFSEEDRLGLLNKMRELILTEKAKLMTVIDMADAALRDLGA